MNRTGAHARKDFKSKFSKTSKASENMVNSNKNSLLESWMWIKKFPSLYKIGLLLAFVLFHWFLFSYFKKFFKSDSGIQSSELSKLFCEKINDIVQTRDLMASGKLNGSNLRDKLNNDSVSNANFSMIQVSHLYPEPLPSSHPCSTFSTPTPCIHKEKLGFQPCPVCYIPFEEPITADVTLDREKNLMLTNLNYVNNKQKWRRNAKEENLSISFGGNPTSEDWKQSFEIKPTMTVHCGFAQSTFPGIDGGFEFSDQDRKDMLRCRGIVVASAIFYDYDEMKQPMHVSTLSEKRICFYMFMDQMSYDSIVGDDGNSGNVYRKIGFWNIVVVKNLPYSNEHKNSRIPKLLLHRLFPNSRYSIWVDGKAQLIVDPISILERFLWRGNYSFAISNHFQRFDAFEESQTVIKLKRDSHPHEIQNQIKFYMENGLRPYSKSKLPLTSDLPESYVVIRDHSHVSNLFGCLWFNEVDKFTSRDQLSFAFVRDKLLSQVPWKINMFLDCERRNFTHLGTHKPQSPKENEIRKKYEAYIDSVGTKPRKISKYKKIGWKKLLSNLKFSN